MMFVKATDTQRQRGQGGRTFYLMCSLVALSLTVEEKEEWVLSSNRKGNADLAVSKRHRGQIKETGGDSHFCTRRTFALS